MNSFDWGFAEPRDRAQTSDDVYINVVRHVVALEDTSERANLSIAARLFWGRDFGDKQTLQSHLDALPDRGALVLIAPPGAGKTVELRQLARRLRAAGKHAAFTEAVGFGAPVGVELDHDEVPALRDMLEAQSGVLIVDAIDELHLHRVGMSSLFRRLRRDVDFTNCAIRLVFSSRNAAWSRSAARELANHLRSVGVENPVHVRFDRLHLETIRTLALAYGETDIDGFMAEFVDQEFDELFELRPPDVKRLVRTRRAHGTLGNWSQAARNHLDAIFVEERPERSAAGFLTLEAARHGLQRVAAATLLSRQQHITLPTSLVDGAHLSSRKLFSDWPASAVSELFESPMFNHKGPNAEAVQLPPTRISHYLAAEWISERAFRGLEPEAIRQMLLVKVPWLPQFQIPSAYKAVAGWVCSGAPGFRRLLADEYPALVLYEGDPSCLSDVEIRQALGSLCKQIASRQWEGWATPATFRQLARATLANDVKDLLALYSYSPSVSMHLLKWVELGRYRSCADLALMCAERSDEALARTLAVRALCSAAPEERQQLLRFTTDQDPYVRHALLVGLAPDLLSGNALVEFVLGNMEHPVSLALDEIGARVTPDVLDKLLGELFQRVSADNVSDETFNAFHVSVAAIIARLRNFSAFQDLHIDLLIALERLQHDHTQANFSEAEERALSEVIDRDPGLRRSLWAARFREVDRSANAYHHVQHPVFGAMKPDDLEWLSSTADERGSNDRGEASQTIDRVWSRLSAADRAATLSKELSPNLRKRLEDRMKWDEELDAKRAAATAKEQAKDAETRDKNRKLISPKLGQIESGTDVAALKWAWGQLEGKGSDDGRFNFERLRRYVGDDHAALFVQGMCRCWRTLDPGLPEPGRVNSIASFGLTAIALDVRLGLELSKLSADEAERAAKLAVHGLNAFPFWFNDLVRAQRAATRRVLTDVLTGEWQNPVEDLDPVLRFGSYSDAEVKAVMREIVLNLLEASSPKHSRSLHFAVDCILTSNLQLGRVTAIARREIFARTEHDANWLRLWAHVEPEPAADWFESSLPSSRPLLLETASLLEQDLNERSGPPVSTALMAPRALGRWCRLLLQSLRVADDVEHEGVYHPDTQDYAQDLRHRCVTRLSANPTVDAHTILVELLNDPVLASERDTLEYALSAQTLAAIEAAPVTWTEEDVLALERGDEKTPRSLAELFQLTQSHLRHVDSLVSNDNFSYRALFSSKTKEREVQLWVASCLRERARGLYSVVRENVEEDDKEVDISAFAAGVGHVPIEIKPLGPYSTRALEKVIVTQLIGKYMLPPDQRCGVLLLVRLVDKTWRHRGQSFSFDDLCQHLRSFAQEIGAKSGKEICIASIDAVSKPAAARLVIHKATTRASPRAKPHRKSRPQTARSPKKARAKKRAARR
jgi:hypothetical protein